jgi:Fe-coproporphyrin III synthase
LHATASATCPPVARLPLVTLYVTDRCNSRCVSCDYWRHGRDDMDLDAVARLLPSFSRLRTETVLLSGGEPLMNPHWADIAALLQGHGIKVWLLTSGLALAKHAALVAERCSAVTVSLDGTDSNTYAAIRGLDAFDKVCEGIRAVAARGVQPGIRVTLQRGNYRQLPGFVDLARQLGARYVSFLAVDVANPSAFGRAKDFVSDLALQPQDLPAFERILTSLEQDRAEDFQSGFIAESPQKLRRIHQYFAAIHRQAAYPPVRCNAPEFSAVVGATGRVQPCFFIAAPPDARLSPPEQASGHSLLDVLSGASMHNLRASIREGRRAECKTCVCSLWRDPESLAGAA